MANVMLESNLSGYLLLSRGKVREFYSVGNNTHIMIIATDRITAFDYILPTPIPQKGVLVTQLSNFWFDKTQHIIANHLDNTDPKEMDWFYEDECCYDQVRNRVILVRKAEPLVFNATVRGYLASSQWEEYKAAGRSCEVTLPSGLRESDKLPEPLYTPCIKAADGEHYENISFEESVALSGVELAEKVRDISLKLYTFAAGYALERGIIIADTKFKFGLIDGKLALIDELLTPDSSHFWAVDGYKPGRSQLSFDKQYVIDYLESTGWDRNRPAPELPAEIVQKTVDKYSEVYERLTG